MSFAPSLDPLLAFLQRNRGQRTSCLVNIGNRGDGLIHKGWRTLRKKLGLDIQEIRFPEPASGDLLLIHGAGALGTTYNSALKEMAFYRPSFTSCAVLPATINPDDFGVRRWLKNLDQSWTVFLREAESLTRARAVNPLFDRFFLSEDLAFQCDLSAWAERPQQGTALCFREDHESAGYYSTEAGQNIDISAGPASEVGILLDFIASKSCVHTDRTHAAIAAAIMGREVHLFPNAYYKNKAIFEHSLARFPNVHFHAHPTNRVDQLWRKATNRFKTTPERLRYLLWVNLRDLRARQKRTPTEVHNESKTPHLDL